MSFPKLFFAFKSERDQNYSDSLTNENYEDINQEKNQRITVNDAMKMKHAVANFLKKLLIRWHQKIFFILGAPILSSLTVYSHS